MAAPLVFITGASSGIGQALAMRYHRAGYRLALVARRASEVKTWAGAQGISADSYEIYSADVTVIDSIVSAFEPPRLLEYSWSSAGEPLRPVRWGTTPENAGTRLTLTLAVPDTEDIARACAGWEAHLQMLLAAIEGVPIKFPFERFKETRAAYKAMVS